MMLTDVLVNNGNNTMYRKPTTILKGYYPIISVNKCKDILSHLDNEVTNKQLKRKFEAYKSSHSIYNAPNDCEEKVVAKKRHIGGVDLYFNKAIDHTKHQLTIQNDLKEKNEDIFSSVFDIKESTHGSNMDFSKGIVDPNSMTGYEILTLLRALLDMFEWEREENQVDFHEHFIATVLPKIFKKEWETEYDKILRLFKKTKHDAETILICPRRWGKTVSVAMFCAAYILAVPDAEIAIFSTAKRTSGKMMMGVLKFMQQLPLFEHCEILTKNAETIRISLYGNERNISCFPGTVAVCIFQFYTHTPPPPPPPLLMLLLIYWTI